MKKEQIIFDFKEAEKEHKRMFPLATPETQLRKLNEEWSEHATAASIEEAYEEYGGLYGYPFKKMTYCYNDKKKAEATFRRYVKKYCKGE